MSSFLVPLHGYQASAVDWILGTPRGALIAGMGLGKTLITLTALERLLSDWEVAQVLVIAPKRVALSTWPDEIQKWSALGLECSVLVGPAAARERAAQSKARIHIINIDALQWLLKLGPWRYDMVVIDESSMFKNAGTKRFRALKKRIGSVDRVLLLTGTPAPNSLMNLWPQVYLLDGGKRLLRTFSAFRDYFFTSDYMGYRWEPRPGAEKEIYGRIADLCLRLDTADYADTPERIDVQVPTPLPAAAREVYDRLERECLVELTGGEVAATTAAVLVGKLLQLTGGALYHEDKGWTEVHDAKLDALAEIAESAQGQPLLVAYNYKHELTRLQKRFPTAEVLDSDPKTIARWNGGEIPMLLAHPASAGHGLNLQAGGSIAVWYGLTYSLELYQQFNARLHRQGQKSVTVAHHLISPDSIDEQVMEALQTKRAGQDALLGALRERSIKHMNRRLRHEHQDTARTHT